MESTFLFFLSLHRFSRTVPDVLGLKFWHTLTHKYCINLYNIYIKYNNLHIEQKRIEGEKNGQTRLKVNLH